MTEDSRPSAILAAETRTVDARLARIHLRGGLIALARAELETMASLGTLDREALADLAEARWRSGDLVGGGEAAQAHRDAGGSEPLALVVAAEALAAEGRLVESRQLATRVTQDAPGLTERLFAGQPRSHSWNGLDDTPAGERDAPQAWGSLSGGREVVTPARRQRRASRPRADAPAEPPEEAQLAPRAAGAVTGATRTGRPDEREDHPGPGEPLPVGELGAIEESIERGDTGSVAARLALMLRLDRALAPVILSLADRAVAHLEAHHPHAAALHLVRGDAYRILGREADATAAFQRSRLALGAEADQQEEPT